LNAESWLDLEKLAALIYAELEPSCEVTHNVRLPGSESETPRQIDVLIRDPASGSLVVVDCKDRKRKVTVVDAQAFAALLEDVEATGGVLLCNRGFSKAARTVAKKRGFSLCQLHDAASRKWRLDVQIPVVWSSLRIVDFGIGVQSWLEKGDSLEKHSAPRFQRAGREVDPLAIFVDDWNAGRVHSHTPGDYQATAQVDLVTADGDLRPDATVTFSYRLAGDSRLGYVTPAEARGILDAETDAFSTVSFDVGKTLETEPEGGWQAIFDPDELAIQLRGTVVTLADVAGLRAEWGGVREMRLIRPGRPDT
jgi:restriction endonuclease